MRPVDVPPAEREREHGPVPHETLEWAAQVVERWERVQIAATTVAAAPDAGTDPRNVASPKAKMPPSAAMSQ